MRVVAGDVSENGRIVDFDDFIGPLRAKDQDIDCNFALPRQSHCRGFGGVAFKFWRLPVLASRITGKMPMTTMSKAASAASS